MTPDYAQAHAYVAALTGGDPDVTPVNFRCIHDKDKTVPAHTYDGTLAQHWQTLCQYQASGYGIFININALDGVGRELANVAYIRVHPVDLDNLSAAQNYQRTTEFTPPPSFAVQSSPGKFHSYWTVAPYQGNDRYNVVQRKLRQLFDGDKAVIDPTRVLRLPGTYNLKYDVPHLVTCWSLAGYGQRIPVETLEAALAAVNVIDGGDGGRHELGDPSLAAPSLEWIQTALKLVDPNNLDRAEWIAISAGIKQAAWSHTDPDTLFALWSNWCSQYDKNDVGENLKQWNSIRNSELGWQSLVNRVPSLKGMVHFQGVDRSETVPSAVPSPGAAPVPPMPDLTPPPLDCSGSYLTHIEQQEWFKGCVYVVNLGEMFTPSGRFLTPGQFNVVYGGKNFIVDDQGKKTNEAWAAATRSTLWTVPQVDHARFLPSRPFGECIADDMDRKGVNTYRPANIRRLQGDVGPFLRHIAAMLPDPGDQKTLIEYLVHCVKFPGFKIPWAPVIQSAEGAGKGVIKLVMGHAIGRSYTYFPNAKQLGDSGSQFNAWMRNKLFILADEIKVDDKRDMIEILKPMISEELIEVQGKGHDQQLEDNFGNWTFFTNWPDAVPINKNARRFAIFYSALQSAQDMLDRGMNEVYFTALYDWLKADGAAIVAEYLLTYPMERGGIPMRAPETSSTAQAISLSRGPVERMIQEAVEDQIAGFRGGWISSIAVAKLIKDSGAVTRAPSAQTIGTILGEMGYAACGRAPRTFFAENIGQRAHLFHLGGVGDTSQYGELQGYA